MKSFCRYAVTIATSGTASQSSLTFAITKVVVWIAAGVVRAVI